MVKVTAVATDICHHGPCMTASPLAAQIGLRILEMVQTGQAPPGSHLREHAIAKNAAGLSIAGARGASRTGYRPNTGSSNTTSIAVVSLRRRRARRSNLRANDLFAAKIISSIAKLPRERLDGKLAEAFTEADLGRQFDLSRAEVKRIVDRMAHEGWIERRPGYGWAFVPILTTVTSFNLSYRFRRAIEPAALLEPTFAPDPEAFARCRAEQQALLDGKLLATDPIELFRLGSRFHEMLARCSGNLLFFDAVQRVNRLRRLLEYRAMVDTQPFRNEAREHLAILDLVEAGQMKKASRFMERHLDKNRKIKMKILNAAARAGNLSNPHLRRQSAFISEPSALTKLSASHFLRWAAAVGSRL